MNEPYCKLSIEKINLFAQTHDFDVYLQLGPGKFVKVINADDDSFEESLQEYSERGLSSLYVKKEIYLKFIDDIENSIDEALNNTLAKNLEERFDNFGRVFNDVKSIVINVGLTQATQQRVEALIEEVIKDTEEDENLEALIEVLASKSDFITAHAFLTSYMVSATLKVMDWVSNSIDKKLITAALFQNIALENDEQAKIYNIQSKKFKNLDDFSRELVLKHPFLGAEIIDSPDFAGEEVKKLILSHHEVPMEGAFPGRLNASRISILEALLVLCGYFSYCCLEYKDKKSLNTISQELNENFNQGTFKRALVALLATTRLMS